MPTPRTRHGRRAAVIAVIAAVALVAAACQPKPPAQPLPIGGLNEAVNGYLNTPDTLAGANDWNCKPTSEHPYPVVLVPGTFTPFGANWVALSPMLKNAGYCVYALNYGMAWFSMERIGGMDPIGSSAGELKTFVNKVLSKTGASKVDIVGHSQGGMMPNYYIKRLGGATKVRTLIGLAPSNHGTTVNGITELGRELGVLGFVNDLITRMGAPGLVDQEQGSAFQLALFGDGDTVAGPRYVVIETNKDMVVTPYTNAFLNGAKNILIQNQCPNDNVGHAGIFLDSPTLQNVMNELGPAQANFQPVCSGYGWAF